MRNLLSERTQDHSARIFLILHRQRLHYLPALSLQPSASSIIRYHSCFPPLPCILPPLRGMALNMRGATKLHASSITLAVAARRTFATSPRTTLRCATRNSPFLSTKVNFAQSFRRGYAELKPVAPAAPEISASNPSSPRKFRLWRWTWRLTKLSLVGGLAYLAYGVYDLRNPEDQFEPDPNKQNLVILGMLLICKLFSRKSLYCHA